MPLTLEKRNLQVLLVEDDPGDHFLVKKTLSKAQTFNVKLDWVSSIADAQVLLSTNVHEIILIDNFLGSESGLDLVRERRAQGDIRPYILLTGQGGHELDLAAEEAGASDFLLKGAEAATLERRLRYNLKFYETSLALLKAEEQHRLYYQNAVEGIFRASLEGLIYEGNPAMLRILGGDMRHERLRFPLSFGSFLSRKDFALLLDHIMVHKAFSGYECLLTDLDGAAVWVSMNCRLLERSGVLSVEGSVTDISQRKRAEERIIFQSLHDRLTDLANRVLLEERITEVLLRSRTESDPQPCLIHMDIDGFKSANQVLGHTGADQLLLAVAARLRSFLTQRDTLARLGGDEFAVLIDEVPSLESARIIASGLLRGFEQKVDVLGQSLQVSLSVGVALATPDVVRSDELMRNADTALQFAKERGHGMLDFFDRSMTERLQRRIDLENAMRVSIAMNGFHVEYQPIVDFATGLISGFESLMRWRHPDLGSISPVEFIPVAESSGLIVELGNFILAESCRQAKEWENKGYGPLFASVNVSGRQFQSENVLELVSQVLAQTGFPGHQLKLEVTESVAMGQVDSIIETMNQLGETGVHIAIDDFGTGYSSLAYLRRFPCDTLKIDRSFVIDLPNQKNDCEIVRAVLAIARALDMQVVAEGIETQEQCQFLRDEGCTFLQGYYASRPLVAEKFEALLRKQQETGGSIFNI
jgi:diguanylate cyclase (GGDEF)-like protein/PAS domain S-box-containing protein